MSSNRTWQCAIQQELAGPSSNRLLNPAGNVVHHREKAHGQGGVGDGQDHADGRRSRSREQCSELRRDFNNIVFKDGESVGDFYMRVTGLVNNMRLLSDTIDKIELVQKMLQVVLEQFDQVAISIKTLLDIRKMTIEELTGQLRAVEQRHKARRLTAEMDSGLLLSIKEKEMILRMQRREKEIVRGGGNNIGGGGFGSSFGSSRPGFSQPSHAREVPRKAAKGYQCRYCKKYEH